MKEKSQQKKGSQILPQLTNRFKQCQDKQSKRKLINKLRSGGELLITARAPFIEINSSRCDESLALITNFKSNPEGYLIDASVDFQQPPNQLGAR